MTTLATLQVQVNDLVEENAFLKRQLGLERNAWAEDRLLLHFGLTPAEAKVLAVLVARRGAIAGRTLLMDTLYGGRDDEPEMKIIDVFVCKLRKKVGGHATIGSKWGAGYYLTTGGLAVCDAVIAGTEVPPLPELPDKPAYGAKARLLAGPTMIAWLEANPSSTAREIAEGAGLSMNGIHSAIERHRREGRVECVSRPLTLSTGQAAGGAWRVTEAGRLWLASIVGSVDE